MEYLMGSIIFFVGLYLITKRIARTEAVSKVYTECLDDAQEDQLDGMAFLEFTFDEKIDLIGKFIEKASEHGYFNLTNEYKLAVMTTYLIRKYNLENKVLEQIINEAAITLGKGK